MYILQGCLDPSAKIISPRSPGSAVWVFIFLAHFVDMKLFDAPLSTKNLIGICLIDPYKINNLLGLSSNNVINSFMPESYSVSDPTSSLGFACLPVLMVWSFL